MLDYNLSTKAWFGRSKRPGSEFSAEFAERNLKKSFIRAKTVLKIFEKDANHKIFKYPSFKNDPENRREIIWILFIVFLITLIMAAAIIHFNEKFALF